MPKGSVSAFIVIGLFLMVIVGSMLLFSSQEPHTETPIVVRETRSAFEAGVQECLAETLEEGLLLLGLQGGYYVAPLASVSTEYSLVPCYYYLGDVRAVLTPGEMLSELEAYIEDNAWACAGGANVSGLDAHLALGRDHVLAELDMPGTIVENGLAVEFERFSAKAPARLDETYDIANNIVTQALRDPDDIDVSLILDLQERYGMKIDMLAGEDTVVYVIQDPKSLVAGEPHMFLFAVLAEENSAPEIFGPQALTGFAGKEVYAKYSATDRESDWLEFFTYSEAFAIHPYTGEINWTPQEPGMYSATIGVSDGTDVTTMDVEVVVE